MNYGYAYFIYTVIYLINSPPDNANHNGHPGACLGSRFPKNSIAPVKAELVAVIAQARHPVIPIIHTHTPFLPLIESAADIFAVLPLRDQADATLALLH